MPAMSLRLSNLSTSSPPRGPTNRIGSASSPSARLVQNADRVTSYASQPTITCCSQNPPDENAVASHSKT